jgi:hypothetical protein
MNTQTRRAIIRPHLTFQCGILDCDINVRALTESVAEEGT